MTITERFADAVAEQELADAAPPELLAVRLARAAAVVLPGAAVGISMFTDDAFRFPVGASDEQAAVAERLQFTVAEGPCIEAHRSASQVIAHEAELASQWPVFYSELITKSPYRAIAAIPLPDGFADVGTIDLFFRDAQELKQLNMTDVAIVTQQVTARLSSSASFTDLESGPKWLDSPSAERRSWVLIAMGILNVALQVTAKDALDMLRAHAYSSRRTVDDVAHAVATAELPPSELGLELNR
jgi:hypothetical protein